MLFFLYIPQNHYFGLEYIDLAIYQGITNYKFQEKFVQSNLCLSLLLDTLCQDTFSEHWAIKVTVFSIIMLNTLKAENKVVYQG